MDIDYLTNLQERYKRPEDIPDYNNPEHPLFNEIYHLIIDSVIKTLDKGFAQTEDSEGSDNFLFVHRFLTYRTQLRYHLNQISFNLTKPNQATENLIT